MVEKINQAVRKALKDPSVVKGMEEGGASVVSNSPAAFGALVRAEVPKWARAAQDAGIRSE